MMQGRLLHILPASAKPTEVADSGGSPKKAPSHKEAKEKKLKDAAGSEFNWNSLFMSVRLRGLAGE